MWTPRRILILTIWLGVFFVVYLGYTSTSIGRIDGLPPLPESYWPNPPMEIVALPERPSVLTRRLRQAFGNDCKEQKWAIRLLIDSRHMVLAAEQFTVRSDGKVLLTPISLALFSKDKNDGQYPEISTIQAREALLTFDRPVSNFSEIGTRRIVKAELANRIEITNNRRREQRDQDLRMTIATGTLHYHEATQRIWTEALVEVHDYRSQPEPHVIKGKGMEMELLTEAPTGKQSNRRHSSATISGVKWVTLHSSVHLDVYTEGQVNLLPGSATARKAAKKADAKTVSGRVHLRIKTPGHFRYEINKQHDRAIFSTQPLGSGSNANLPRHVEAIRTQLATGIRDQLYCTQLTMQLRRKDSPAPAASKQARNTPTGQMEAVEIETVQATGKEVKLVSNSENLSASGSDFFHDAINQLTILKGDPVEVERDDGRIVARELRILNVTQNRPAAPGKPTTTPVPPSAEPLRNYQHVEAQGPGNIVSRDRKQGRTLRASWQKLLTSTREGNQDLLILTGKAHFLDEQANQRLSAETLKVWLDEPEGQRATPRGDLTQSRRPRHLEATGNVIARSSDMNIHDTGKLVVWFEDVPAQKVLPTPPPPSQPKPPEAVPVPGTNSHPPVGRPLPQGPAKPGQLTSNPANRPLGPQLGTEAGDRSKARPFDLTAHIVEARILRAGEVQSIDQLWCQGKVRIRQEADRPGEKGTRIQGETLRMTAQQDRLYELIVTGDRLDGVGNNQPEADLAMLFTDKISIMGPEVTIDQAANKAWVVGAGAMDMESGTNFQGETLERPVPMTVLWQKSMLFTGDSAEFHGDIQATQDNSKMACQRLQVYFDRAVSLRQNARTDEPARVKTLVCDREVRIIDTTMVGDRVVKYMRLESLGLDMITLESDTPVGVSLRPDPAKKSRSGGNEIHASGPGNFRIWEASSSDQPLSLGIAPAANGSQPARSPNGEKTSVMKMTYVAFDRRMDANSKRGTADFYSNVRVLHIPCPRHDTHIDLEAILATDLPPDSLYIRSDQLKVLDRPGTGGTSKEMHARGRIYTQGRDFYAWADELHYNQQKQQVILEGKESGLAKLYKLGSRPGEKEEVVAERIIFNRSTGKIDVSGLKSISGQNSSNQK